MQATITTTYDPFHPARGRQTRIITAPARLADLAPVTRRPFICLVNGRYILRRDWDYGVSDSDVVTFITVPQGGRGGSNPLRVLLMIAVIIIAPYIAHVIAPGLSTSSLAFSVLKAGIVMVGSMMVNALLPPPKLPSYQQAAALASPSPTYNLQAQGNYARLDSAIPVHYGRLKFFPDFAAQPYAEYQGNEQYLYQLFVLGRGEYELESINIEDSPISSWDDITYEVVAPGGSLTLFPDNVLTSGEVAGQELLDAGYSGPFTISGPDTNANYIGVDIVLSRGLYHYNTTSGAVEADTIGFKIEARLVGGSTYTVLDDRTITAATTTPQRYSYRYSVTPGRYEVRAIRTDAKQTGTEYGNDVLWEGLRAYMQNTEDFGDVTLLAMRMRASNNLSVQASRKINVIATRKLLAWNGSAWSGSTSATTSIAWALADALKADYGGKLADARIDLQALYDLDAVWAARGDSFNARFDNTSTLWEALTQIAQAGRARPYLQGGIVCFFRDAAQSSVVALYSMRNITTGSFGIDYLLPSEENADSVSVSYLSEDTWNSEVVTGALSWSESTKPAKLALFGVTDREQAYREAVYHAACNFYRRRIIHLETEMEGFIPSPGDLIAIQHDMPAWGIFAEVVAWDSGANKMTVSEPIASGYTSGYVGLRQKNGSMSGPYAASRGSTDYELILETVPPTPYVGMDYERTHVTFGVGDTWRQEAVVISVSPRDALHVEITAVNEDPSVHTADEGLTAPPINSSQLSTLYTLPTVRGIVGRSMPGDPTIMLLSWSQAPGAEYYIVEQSQDQTDWTRICETRASNYSGKALYAGNTVVRIAAVGMTKGPWTVWYYGDNSDLMWSSDSNLMWDADSGTLMWRT